MYEAVGRIVVWLVGAALAFYLPLFAFAIFGRSGSQLGDMLLALWASFLALAVYVAATVVWLA